MLEIRSIFCRSKKGRAKGVTVGGGEGRGGPVKKQWWSGVSVAVGERREAKEGRWWWLVGGGVGSRGRG